MARSLEHPGFARTYLALCRTAERLGAAPGHRRLLRGLEGRVLELGPGPGSTFRAYPAEVEAVVALEPEPLLRAAAQQAAARVSQRVVVVAGVGEALPLAEGSVDAVVSSLVLCSVGDLPAVVAEIRRVLRPGGVFRFVEHVRSPRPARARVQAGLGPLWSKVAGGCHLDRDTPSALRAGGLELSWTRRLPFGPADVLGLLAPLVLGEARRPLVEASPTPIPGGSGPSR
ncbi:class I SAM-dependent methyltransferase [Aciditerrimonas ferrireducens]|uniref:class I SAM-dependent methyltransferase n=1 Tax=Aciditerrimonas ferrireducens TaxID=667306 RepID=UPI00200538E4|nr:class I SAM-dependent methyltransferase [Aciditerrimonas ferrireducens]MCK4176751.1 class I SAM-dependent methyltransferase [Aciditerrimonas ferrireducens]